MPVKMIGSGVRSQVREDANGSLIGPNSKPGRFSIPASTSAPYGRKQQLIQESDPIAGQAIVLENSETSKLYLNAEMPWVMRKGSERKTERAVCGAAPARVAAQLRITPVENQWLRPIRPGRFNELYISPSGLSLSTASENRASRYLWLTAGPTKQPQRPHLTTLRLAATYALTQHKHSPSDKQANPLPGLNWRLYQITANTPAHSPNRCAAKQRHRL